MQSLRSCLDQQLLLDPFPGVVLEEAQLPYPSDTGSLQKQDAVPDIFSVWSHTQDLGTDRDLKMDESFSQTALSGYHFRDTNFPLMLIEPGCPTMHRTSTLSSSIYYSNSDTVESADSSLDPTCKPCEEQVDGSDDISLRGFPLDDENEFKRIRHSRVEKNYRNRLNYKFDSPREVLKETTCKGRNPRKGKRGKMSRGLALDIAQETISNLSLENKSLHHEVQLLSNLMREQGTVRLYS